MEGRLSVPPLPAGVGEELGRREVGRAIRTTPRKEIRAAYCSERVNGSWIRMEQAQQATVGARKVITVASDRGRYSRESAWAIDFSEGGQIEGGGHQNAAQGLQYMPYTVRVSSVQRFVLIRGERH